MCVCVCKCKRETFTKRPRYRMCVCCIKEAYFILYEIVTYEMWNKTWNKMHWKTILMICFTVICVHIIVSLTGKQRGQVQSGRNRLKKFSDCTLFFYTVQRLQYGTNYEHYNSGCRDWFYSNDPKTFHNLKWETHYPPAKSSGTAHPPYTCIHACAGKQLHVWNITHLPMSSNWH